MEMESDPMETEAITPGGPKPTSAVRRPTSPPPREFDFAYSSAGSIVTYDDNGTYKNISTVHKYEEEPQDQDDDESTVTFTFNNVDLHHNIIEHALKVKRSQEEPKEHVQQQRTMMNVTFNNIDLFDNLYNTDEFKAAKSEALTMPLSGVVIRSQVTKMKQEEIFRKGENPFYRPKPTEILEGQPEAKKIKLDFPEPEVKMASPFMKSRTAKDNLEVKVYLPLYKTQDVKTFSPFFGPRGGGHEFPEIKDVEDFPKVPPNSPLYKLGFQNIPEMKGDTVFFKPRAQEYPEGVLKTVTASPFNNPRAEHFREVKTTSPFYKPRPENFPEAQEFSDVKTGSPFYKQ